MTPLQLAILATLPWLLFVLVAWLRARGNRDLNDEVLDNRGAHPHVTVVIPARDEERSIERCVRSVLATTYRDVDVIVVDDHSTDRTGEIARTLAARDPRLRVIHPPELPPGWFGKSWACLTGARLSEGEWLLFLDADTAHSPELISRLVSAAASRGAALISVAGTQELGTFWERLVQPLIFSMLFIRYGGTELVERSRRPADKIANGQCILVRRSAYESIGGHEAVRDKVAEDLMLAQKIFMSGGRVCLVIGREHLSTRMYTSLRELVRGWGKNVFAGSADTMPIGGNAGRLLAPLLLLLGPALLLLPPVLWALAASGIVGIPAIAAAVPTLAIMLTFAMVYRSFGVAPWYALIYPAGAAVLLWIFAGAVARGRNVSWKGRAYRSA